MRTKLKLKGEKVIEVENSVIVSDGISHEVKVQRLKGKIRLKVDLNSAEKEVEGWNRS